MRVYCTCAFKVSMRKMIESDNEILRRKEVVLELLSSVRDPTIHTIGSYIHVDTKQLLFNIQWSKQGLHEAMRSPFVERFKILWHQQVGLTSTAIEWLEKQDDKILRR